MPTPDDLAGGITDADKVILNNAGETADAPGEFVYDGTDFVFRDSVGPFNPRVGGGISEAQHEALDTLAHEIVENSFDEITRIGPRVTNITSWTDAGKTTKIRETQFSYTGPRLTTLVEIQYDAAGTEAYRITETYTYIGVRLQTTTRTRTP